MVFTVSARPATIQDATALGQWYDEDVQRLADHRPKVIAADGHRVRVEAILTDPTRHLLILQHAAIRIGAALVERSNDGWSIRILLKPAYLGRAFTAQAATAARTWLAGIAPGAKARLDLPAGFETDAPA